MAKISIIVCSRVSGNKNFGLLNLLDSLKQMSSNYNNFEVLVKFDSDDRKVRKVLPKLADYPFRIKYMIEPRGRGYIDLHVFYNRLFSQADERSVVIGAVADDFEIIQEGWDEIILSKTDVFPDQIFIIHGRPHPPIQRDNYEQEKFFMSYDINRAEDLVIIDEAPLWSRKLLDICGGFGHLSFTDVWTLMLEYFLYHRCGIKRTIFLEQPLIRRILNEKVDKFSSSRWWTDRVENFAFTRSHFYRAMVEEQALNIFSRIKLLEQSSLPAPIVNQDFAINIRKLEPPTFYQNLKKAAVNLIPHSMRPSLRRRFGRIADRFFPPQTLGYIDFQKRIW